MFDEELVDRVGFHPGLHREHLRCCRGGGDAEHDPVVAAELVDGGGEGGGLAGAGRADHQDQIRAAGDRGGGLGLCHRQRGEGPIRGGRFQAPGVGDAAVRPREEVRLLVEDRASGERSIERRLAHRTTVPTEHGTGRHRAGHVDTTGHRHLAGKPLHPVDHPAGGEDGGGGERGGDLSDQLRGPPRRLLLDEGSHRLIRHPA